MTRRLVNIVTQVASLHKLETTGVEERGRTARLALVEMAELRKQLLQERRYAARVSVPTTRMAVDPRLVYTELFLSSLLRPRQVELLKLFQSDIRDKKSTASQLIMGQVAL